MKISTLGVGFFACVLFASVLASASQYAHADHNTAEALEVRTAPVGGLNVVAGGVAAVVGGAARSGEEVYNATCAACHGAGIAGAPKTGDAAGWATRIAQGMATLVAHAIDGFTGDTGVMLPKGGNASLSDDEVEAAVEFMVEESR